MHRFPLRSVILCACLLLMAGSLLPAQQSDSTVWRIKQVTVTPPLPAKVDRQVKRTMDGAHSREEADELAAALGQRMAAKGWAEFAIDSIQREGKDLKLQMHLGPHYCYDSIVLDGLNETYLEKTGFERMARRHAPLAWDDLQGRLRMCLEAYQDRGHPFAAFDSLQVGYRQLGEDTVAASIRYGFTPGPLVLIDSVVILGKVREKPSFVQNLIGIYPGDKFDQGSIDKVQRLLNSSPYFKGAKAAKVEFVSETKARLILDFESRKSGKFDVLLGILPPSNNTAKLQFTGLVDLQLVSPIFRAGELIQFRFDKLVGNSQKLNLRFAMPYLFGSPMGVDGEFNLLKQDTTFLTRSVKVAAPYAFSPSLSVRAFYKNRSSSLISTQRYEADTTLVPPVLDGRDHTYGLGFSFESLDDRFSPTRGWRIKVEGGLGSKKVVKNPRLAESIYSGVERNLPKAETELRAEWYQRLGKRLVLMLANSSYWLDQRQYFQNDLMQVGGSRSIRGFNENQFYTNLYSCMTVEQRFLLEERSYLFVFSDIAYLEDKVGPVSVMRPWGLGLGLNYETKAGMLSITYAAGQVAGAPFQPARGKIHIGLVNQF